MPIRVTRIYVDALGNVPSAIRATRIYVDALGTVPSSIRTTRIYVDILGVTNFSSARLERSGIQVLFTFEQIQTASSQIVLTQEAELFEILLDASSAITLTQTAVSTIPIDAAASNALILAHTAVADLSTFGRLAQSSITLTQSAESSIKNLFAITPDPQSDAPESLPNFTEGWETTAYLAQTFDLTASSTLTLSQTLPQPTGRRSVFADSTIVFNQFADTDVKTRNVVTLFDTLTDTATVEKILLASSTIVITQSAINGIVNLVAESTLSFIQTASPGPFSRDASTDIDIDNTWIQTVTSSIKNISASSTITLQDSNNVLRPWYADAESEVQGVTGPTVDLGPPDVFVPGGPFGLADEATYTMDPTRSATSILSFLSQADGVFVSASAIDLTATTLIGFVDEATLSIVADAVTTLTLQDTASGDLNVLTAISSLLDETLDHTATVTIDRFNIPATNTLDLKHSVAYTIIRDTTPCYYAPFIGTSAGDTTPPRPLLPEQRIPQLPGIRFRLVYPPFDTGATIDTVDLRAPSFGNRERLEPTRIQRESVGGTLHIFADPIWPKVHMLQMQFQALKTVVARDLLRFIERWIGQEIGIYDYEGRIWKGVITNPTEAVVHDRRESWSATLEIEAERIYQLNRIARTNFGLQTQATIGDIALSSLVLTDDSDFVLMPLALSGSNLSMSNTANYTIIPAGPGVSSLVLDQSAQSNEFFYSNSNSPITLNQTATGTL